MKNATSRSKQSYIVTSAQHHDFYFEQRTVQNILMSKYSRSSMSRTPIARLLWLFRTCSGVPRELVS